VWPSLTFLSRKLKRILLRRGKSPRSITHTPFKNYPFVPHQLYFNSINGATGRVSLPPPMTWDTSRIAQGEPPEEAHLQG
jgi:hypothetical protein